jgi:diguanylate cyclase
LTGLPSRSAFTDELGRRVEESTRTEADVSLVVLEIDQLAAITEEHGEQTADLVRCGVAAFLTAIMRDMDLVARSSENSFCMMLPACTLDDATRAAERYRIAASKTPFQIDELELQLTLSAGVTLAAQGEPPDSLMKRGQKALTTSLQSGGNRTSVEESPTEDNVTADDAAAVDDAPAADDVAAEESVEPAEEALSVS